MRTEAQMERKREPEEIHLVGLYTRNLGANLLGFITVVVLNLFTPLELFEIDKAVILAEKGWVITLFFHPLIICAAGFLQYLIQRPLSELMNRFRAGKKVQTKLKEKAKRRLLNLPIILSMVSLGMWIVITALVVILFEFSEIVSARAPLFIFFRSVMIGMVSSALSFFLVENYSRKNLIPWFFPQGKLSAVPGTLKIPIGRRIRVLYMAGTSIPMVILVGTLSFVLWRMEEDSFITLMEFGREVLIFSVILWMIFVVIALSLSRLVRKSISNPLGEILDVVGKVKGGDFTKRIRVVSNDEIGTLGDTGNEMITALIDRDKIRDTFGKYVTPEIRDKILAGRIPVNGERREATVLFSDLRAFTSYVQENKSEEVIKSMRAYFTAMETAIHRYKGLVLQYVGDEVEGVFGVPIAYEGHADQAVLAALEMRKNLDALNETRLKEGKKPFKHGIGIHTGEVLAGNTGSHDRLSYALIGDTVNLGSRIEDLTKKFHCDILISEDTVKHLTSSFEMKKCPPHKVKGYSKPITVFQIVN